MLTSLGDRVPSMCAEHAGACSVEVVELTTAMSLAFPASVTSLIRDRAAALGIRTSTSCPPPVTTRVSFMRSAQRA